MAIRLQEIHPAAVHFPIALLPASLVADAVGTVTGDASLREMGRRGILGAAGAAVAAAVSGVVAQEASVWDEESRAALVTHRTINLGLIGVLAGMAAYRVGRPTPGPGYFAAGAASLGLAFYGAYLGGLLVFEHGVGVRGRGKLMPDEAPPLEVGQGAEVARVAAGHAWRGLGDVFGTMARGEFLPRLTHRRPAPRDSRTPARARPAAASGRW